jgi:hypothetical protein
MLGPWPTKPDLFWNPSISGEAGQVDRVRYVEILPENLLDIWTLSN